MTQRRPVILVLAALVLVAAVWSFLGLAVPGQRSLDQRTQDIAAQLKCPVCQNESVADSPALLAQQMRFVIRQQLQAGKSDQEVIQFFVKSYGGQIVWSPPWQGFTLLIWLVPIGLLLLGGLLVFLLLRDWQRRGLTKATTSGTGAIAKPATLKMAQDSEPPRDQQLEHYRALLEEELAAEDVLFARKENGHRTGTFLRRTEASS